MSNWIEVTVYHNEGPGRFFEFDVDMAKLVDKGTYDFHVEQDGHWLATDTMKLLEEVFRVFNVGDPAKDHRARQYRAEYRARSLSVGDVIVVGEVAYSVKRLGFDGVSTREFEKAREDAL